MSKHSQVKSAYYTQLKQIVEMISRHKNISEESVQDVLDSATEDEMGIRSDFDMFALAAQSRIEYKYNCWIEHDGEEVRVGFWSTQKLSDNSHSPNVIAGENK